jgi:hypothetical protein
MQKAGGGRVYEIGSAWDLRQRETNFCLSQKQPFSEDLFVEAQNFPPLQKPT